MLPQSKKDIWANYNMVVKFDFRFQYVIILFVFIDKWYLIWKYYYLISDRHLVFWTKNVLILCS